MEQSRAEQNLDEKDMSNNILKITEEVDLSPRQSSSLKDGNKKDRFVVPLQVKIRSNKRGGSMLDPVKLYIGN